MIINEQLAMVIWIKQITLKVKNSFIVMYN